jgi:hypothetical protein
MEDNGRKYGYQNNSIFYNITQVVSNNLIILYITEREVGLFEMLILSSI